MKHTLSAAAFLAAAALHAGSISMNFSPADKTGDIVAGTRYGLLHVDGAHWNKITAVQQNGFPAATALVNESGAATEATVAISSNTMQNYNDSALAPLLRSAIRDYGDATHDGYPQVKVENIPYGRYDLYVYMYNDVYNQNTGLTLSFDGTDDTDHYYMDGIITKTSTEHTGWGKRTKAPLTLKSTGGVEKAGKGRKALAGSGLARIEGGLLS